MIITPQMIQDYEKRFFLLCLVVCLLIPSIVFIVIFTSDIEDIVRLSPDDAFYYLNIARYIAEEGRPTFDGLTITTGFHPLYVGILVTLFKTFSPNLENFARLALILNGILYLGTLLIAFATSRLIAPKRGALLLLLIFITSPRISTFSLSGMEASLNLFTAICFIYLFIRWMSLDDRSTYNLGRGIMLGIFGASMALTRTENIMFVLVALAAGCWIRGKKQAWNSLSIASIAGAISLSATGLWIAYCKLVSGSFLQSSASMKEIFRSMETEGMSSSEVFLYSADHFFEFLLELTLAVPAFKYLLISGAFISFFRFSPNRKLVGIFLTTPIAYGLLYAIKLPGISSWYLALSITLLATSCAFCLAHVLQNADTQKWRRAVQLLIALIALEALITIPISIYRRQQSTKAESLQIARTTLSSLPSGSVVGSWNAGIFGYFADATVVNLDGLVNQEIVTAFRNNELNWPYWKKRELTHLAEDKKWFDNISPCFSDSCLRKLREHKLDEKHSILVYEIIPR